MAVTSVGKGDDKRYIFSCIACNPTFVSDRYFYRAVAVYMRVEHDKKKHQ
jgi:hypothetical protein